MNLDIKAKHWTTLGIRIRDVKPSEVHMVSLCVHNPFKSHWLIVTSPGFFIEEATVGMVTFLHQVHGDIYLPGAWDELERISQLDRVKLGAPPAYVGNAIMFRVMNANNAEPRDFVAGLIGEELITAGAMRI